MWWDESLSHYRATQDIPFILSNKILLTSGPGYVETVDNHPPLYFVMLRLLVLLAGESEFAMRFLSLACGVAIVPLTWACGKRLFGADTGLIAATIAAISPLYLWYSQEIRPYTLVVLWALLSAYSLFRVLDGSRSKLWIPAFLGSVAAMLATHYLGFLLLAAEGLILVLSWRRMSKMVLWVLLALAVIGGAIFVWGLMAMPKQAEVPSFRFLALGLLVNDVFQQFTLGLYADILWPLRWVAVGLFVVSLLLLLVHRRDRQTSEVHESVGDSLRRSGDGQSRHGTVLETSEVFEPTGSQTPQQAGSVSLRLDVGKDHGGLESGAVPLRHTLSVLLCFALPILLIYAISFVRPAYMNIRHLIFASPFYYLLLAAGVAHARRTWTRALVGAAWLAVIVAMALSTTIYFGSSIYGRADHRGWGRYLSEHVREGDLVIVNPGPVSDLFEYYADVPAPWIGLPYIPHETRTREYLAAESGRFECIWVAYSSTPAWANQQNIPLEWLANYATETDFAAFTSSTTTLYVKAFRLSPPAVETLPTDVIPVNLNFGDRLHLVGWTTEVPTTAAGGLLQLSLYWRPTVSLDRQYRMTLSLTDDEGYTWAERDYEPAYGAYPTRQWSIERYMHDDVDLRVPPGVPPGRYRLNVSVYPEDKSEPALAAHSLETGQLVGLIVPVGQVEITVPSEPPPDAEIPIRYPAYRRYGRLSLLGHNYGGGSYQPGDVALLDAYWRANRVPNRDVTFEILLLDENKTVIARRTVSPAGSYLPTQWHKGQVIRGQFRFRFPIDVPPGKYTLALASGGVRPARSTWPWQVGPVSLSRVTVVETSANRTFEVPDMQYTVGANLGDRVELLGYDLTSESVRPGEVVSCTLYWRALQVMNENYTVFNHLVGADGQTWGQWDNQPQQGRSPTTRWVPGQVIEDPYQIPVSADAPIGPLTLQVGMYDLQNMLRLPLHDANGQVIGDHIKLTEVEATRP